MALGQGKSEQKCKAQKVAVLLGPCTSKSKAATTRARLMPYALHSALVTCHLVLLVSPGPCKRGPMTVMCVQVPDYKDLRLSCGWYRFLIFVVRVTKILLDFWAVSWARRLLLPF